MNKLKLIAFASIFSLALVSCEKEENSALEPVENSDFNLNGAQVVPTSASTATGTIKGSYNPRTKVFAYTIAWSGLTGGNIAAMHIHGVADRGFVAIPLAPLAAYPNGIVQNITGYTNAASGSFSGSLYVDGTVVKEHDLRAGKFYVDIHTAGFPGGEIRGQILFP